MRLDESREALQEGFWFRLLLKQKNQAATSEKQQSYEVEKRNIIYVSHNSSLVIINGNKISQTRSKLLCRTKTLEPNTIRLTLSVSIQFFQLF